MINTKLKEKRMVAEGTMEFVFEKPEGFEFKPGQFVEIGLIDPPETDAEGNGRAFSIVAAPHENHLTIATRMRNTAFKRVLSKMDTEKEVTLDGPFGSFTLHNDASRPAVFLIGGIGITPVISIIKNAAQKALPHHIYLFYSNRRPEDSAFLEELTELQSKNPNYKVIATMTEMEKSTKPWTGKTGYITKEMIGEEIQDLTKPIFYSAGPAGMVAAMRKLLNDAGVDDDNIRTEEFSGY